MTGVDGSPGKTLGEVLAARRRRTFTGRTSETDLFRAALETDDPPFSVLHVHGPGGIGKSTLLGALDQVASDAGAHVVRLDGRDLDPSPAAVLDALGKRLETPEDDGGQPGRVVLLVDGYELLAPLDDWFRASLIPRLPGSAITVLAGREPPAAEWRADPAWGDLLRVVSLRNLDPDDSRAYLLARGVDEALHERIMQATYGHPLALSLAADLTVRGGRLGPGPLPPDVVEALLKRFVESVPSERHRHALRVCAVARTTTVALLRETPGPDDAHALFDWLRDLSFVQEGPDGLYPHDLARDVLDHDLRWRDFDHYQQVYREVCAHSTARLRGAAGRAQQRAIFDLKFLFRHLRSVMSPVEWDSWGEYYPDRAGPADREAILGLVRDREGPESAAIAARWLDRQPDGFSVIRGHDRAIRGVLAIVDLTRASAADLDGDPGARAAWDFAHRTAPPRPGETVTQCRFVIDRDRYQDPSPTLNATPVLTTQHQLSTPDLAWDFITLADPDRWNDYFAAAGLPRAEGADFAVGGRAFGLFAHDFRAVPIDALTALWAERALADDAAVQQPGTAPALLVLSHADFVEAVRQGLRDLRRPDLLARNPLLRTRLLTERAADGAPDAETLEALLREAVEALAEHPRDDKLLRAVERTYVHATATQEAAAAMLGLPFSTYRRHLTQGVSRIVSALWEKELGRTELSKDRPGD
ncbi:ATP-binding protein [Actinomadura welshii]